MNVLKTEDQIKKLAYDDGYGEGVRTALNFAIKWLEGSGEEMTFGPAQAESRRLIELVKKLQLQP